MMKNFINQTINQHYISQAEQRLNAINPDAKSNKQRIYSFNIIDRELYKIELENDKGKLIENNLSIFDLYSFDIDEEYKKLRFNFELLFNKYESDIIAHTQSLLKKIHNNDQNILNELFNIFVLKTLNSFRNPFCIKKTINTLSYFNDCYPTDSVLKDAYIRIIKGKKQQQRYLCEYLKVTEQEYNSWLRILLMLFVEITIDGKKSNLLENIIISLYENKDYYKNVIISYYDHSPVLLSDRGFNSIDNDITFYSTEFNLSSSAFIIYSFTSLDNFAKNNSFTTERQQKIVDKIKELEGHTVHVNYMQNNMDLLDIYNKRTIEHAYSHVFCAKRYTE